MTDIHTTLDIKAAIIQNPILVTPDEIVTNVLARIIPNICSILSEGEGMLCPLKEPRNSCVLVVEEAGIVGIFTERDAICINAQGKRLSEIKVAEVMTKPVITIQDSDLTNPSLPMELLSRYQISHLPVLNKQKMVLGVITPESLQKTLRLMNITRSRLVSEVMITQVVQALPCDSIMHLRTLLAGHQVSSVVIVEEREQMATIAGSSTTTTDPNHDPSSLPRFPIGIVTEQDILQAQVLELDFERVEAKAIMSTPAFSVSAQETLWMVLSLMQRHQVSRVVVTGQWGELLGIITPSSWLRVMHPWEIYETVQALQQQVDQLQAEKLSLLKGQTSQVEKLLQERTAELQARTLQERLVTKIATHIRGSLNLPDVLNAAVTKVKAFLECDRVSIYQLLPNGHIVVGADCAEPHLPSFTGQEVPPFLETYWHESNRGISARLISDINTAELTEDFRNFLESLPIRAFLFVPILNTDQLWGVLCASESYRPRDWHPSDGVLLQEIANQLIFAVQQATTYQQAQAELFAQRRIEAIVLQSQRRYELLTEKSPVGIFRTDPSGKCLYVNNRWCEISGVADRQVLDQNWLAYIHPQDQQRVAMGWEAVAQSNQPFRQEFRFQRSHGQDIWVYGQALAEFNPDGEITGYVGTITDITDRKQAELSLQESEAKYRLLVENQTDLIVKVDANGNLLFVSPSYCELLGKTETELLNKPYLPLVHEEDWERTKQAREALRLPPYTCYVEQRVMTQDGWRWLGWSSKGVLDEQGKIIATVGVGRDITLLKQTQQALRQLNRELEAKVEERTAQLQSSEAELRTLFAAMPDTVVVRNRQGVCLKVAPNSTNLVLPAEEMLGKTLHEIFPPKEADLLLGRIQEALDQQSIVSAEYSLQLQGKLVTLLATIAPLTTESVVIVGRDISDRKQVEQQLRQANIELMQATRMKDDFLANMSHELRTPLNAILGMTEGLQDKVFGEVSAQQVKALKTIERSGKHLLALITDILDLSKIEAGKLELDISTVSIQTLCEASLSFVSPMALQKTICLQSHIDPGINFINGDERRLHQVLINLLTNAVKFTPTGGTVTLEVHVEENTNPDQFCPSLVISVIDTGIGIAEDDQKKLFQSFVQIDGKLNRQQAGTGLGLALVKRLTELHGGRVSVTSTVGQGSCFTVCLPYQTHAAHASPVAPGRAVFNAQVTRVNPQSASMTVNSSTRSPLILLAEDQEANIITISSYLESRGYRLVVAHDGQEAIDCTKTHQPDLILMDIQMPGMDGLEAISVIRSNPELPLLPIIALTALAMEGDREKCLKAGANEYLSKPVRLKELVATIQRLLEASVECDLK